MKELFQFKKEESKMVGICSILALIWTQYKSFYYKLLNISEQWFLTIMGVLGITSDLKKPTVFRKEIRFFFKCSKRCEFLSILDIFNTRCIFYSQNGVLEDYCLKNQQILKVGWTWSINERPKGEARAVVLNWWSIFIC